MRALVTDAAVAEAFNRWYNSEHVPEATRRFEGVRRVTRWRSMTEPGLFTTVYEFDEVASVERAIGSDAMRELVAEFDHLWSAR